MNFKNADHPRDWRAKTIRVNTASLAVAVFGATAAVGVAAIAACLKSLRLGVFPAPGTWSWALRHKLTGRQAVLAARVGMGLGATLVLVSAAGGGLLWYMAAVVRACRAH